MTTLSIVPPLEETGAPAPEAVSCAAAPTGTGRPQEESTPPWPARELDLKQVAAVLGVCPQEVAQHVLWDRLPSVRGKEFDTVSEGALGEFVSSRGEW